MPYTPGDHWIICDISGRKVLFSKSKKTWDGLRVHPDYWYPRHPQLDVRAVPDDQSVLDARPRPQDLFIQNTGYLLEPFLEEVDGFLGPDLDVSVRIRPPVIAEEL